MAVDYEHRVAHLIEYAGLPRSQEVDAPQARQSPDEHQHASRKDSETEVQSSHRLEAGCEGDVQHKDAADAADQRQDLGAIETP